MLKLDYVNVTWEEEYLKIGMKQFKTQVFLKSLFGLLLEPDIFCSFLLTRQSMNPCRKKDLPAVLAMGTTGMLQYLLM